MTKAAIIKKPVYLQSKSIDWFLYDRDIRHERVKFVDLTTIIKIGCGTKFCGKSCSAINFLVIIR